MSGPVYESSVKGDGNGRFLARVWRYRGRQRYFERTFDTIDEARDWAQSVGWKGKKGDRVHV